MEASDRMPQYQSAGTKRQVRPEELGTGPFHQMEVIGTRGLEKWAVVRTRKDTAKRCLI